MASRSDQKLRQNPEHIAIACNEACYEFDHDNALDMLQNRFSGEEYELNNIELSMYDFVIGSTMVLEMTGGYKHTRVEDLRKGLDWFRKNNAKAYMVLLD